MKKPGAGAFTACTGICLPPGGSAPLGARGGRDEAVDEELGTAGGVPLGLDGLLYGREAGACGALLVTHTLAVNHRVETVAQLGGAEIERVVGDGRAIAIDAHLADHGHVAALEAVGAVGGLDLLGRSEGC